MPDKRRHKYLSSYFKYIQLCLVTMIQRGRLNAPAPETKTVIHPQAGDLHGGGDRY
jgi:hypothetical protein